MIREEIETICKERLEGWQKRLVDEHSTPILVVGVGHDHKKGQLVLCIPEEMTRLEVMVFLEGALNMMRTGRSNI